MLVVTLVISCYVIFITIKFLKWANYQRIIHNEYFKLPGDHGYPILGNIYQCIFLNSRELFKKQNQDSLKYYPIYKMWSLHIMGVIMVSPEDMEPILTNMKHIAKPPVYDFLQGWLGTGLLTGSGAKWISRRKMLTPAFHLNLMQDFLNIFNGETKSLVKELESECRTSNIDVLELITQFTLKSILGTVLGTKVSLTTKEKRQYWRGIHAFGETITYRTLRPWLYPKIFFYFTKHYLKQERMTKKLHELSKNIINEKKKNYSESNKLSYSTKKKLAMLDLLIDYQANGADLDDEGIREEVDTFMFAGHDTSSVAICYTLLELASHENVQDNILKEIYEVMGENNINDPTYQDLQNLSYLDRCIKEVLRLYPSVPRIARICGEDLTTPSGYKVYKGMHIGLSIYDMHHNPNVYPDPEKFDPDRFLPENVSKRHPFAYLPFSAGPRNCIGQKFAISEIKAVICGILKNFSLEAVDKRQDIKFLFDIVLRPDGPIRIKFKPRKMD